MNELIIVKQLPLIEEHLREFKAAVDKRVEEATALVCTEETLQTVKKTRAELNGEFKSLEEQRKAVKKQILEPYDLFESVYKTCVSDAFKKADMILKSNIDTVEEGLRLEKQQRILEYFEELKIVAGLDWLDFDALNIPVIRSVSDKKIKEQISKRIEEIVDDLGFLDSQSHLSKAELLIEYKKTLNPKIAVQIVADRKAAVEAEQKRAEERAKTEELKKQAEEKVDEVIEEQNEVFKPAETIEPVYEVKMTVRGTKAQIKALCEYMEKEGISYHD